MIAPGLELKFTGYKDKVGNTKIRKLEDFKLLRLGVCKIGITASAVVVRGYRLGSPPKSTLSLLR